MLAAANRGDVGRQLELMSPAPDAPRTIYPCPDAHRRVNVWFTAEADLRKRVSAAAPALDLTF